MLFERVLELSKKQGKSLKQVAEELGLSRNAIYQWKTSSPKAETLEKVASYFNTTTDYLLGRTDDKTDSKVIDRTLSPKGRAIGRGFDKLSNDQQELFERLLLQMQEDDDEDD